MSIAHNNYSVLNAYKLMMLSLYCRLQCTVILVSVVLKGSLGGTTF